MGQSSLGVNLFPVKGELFGNKVTRNVSISSSLVYMVEMGSWAYSIRMRQLRMDEEGYENEEKRGFKHCILTSRHLIIGNQHVRGDAVIGFYPILCEGGWILNSRSDPHHQYARNRYVFLDAEEKRVEETPKEGDFIYQSQTGSSRAEIFGGDFHFVPYDEKSHNGRSDQAGFDATMVSIPLKTPGFLY
eukprot:CAMPEP_0185267670 /NCGR_PEP_ID=MMETSP1359-20130426/34967_1 /TAXON_ID=552665 /ORGANISM="Bigelowiella longifila, Strain CCMP242" /LENGTH=188 /DNA_ID=CAMNT_0027858097 /DNA_START=118 /DNA_END=684 /DNA_ORIENTATION=-